MNKQPRSNLEILTIIVAAWNLGMADANAICAKSEVNINEELIPLMEFISGKEISLNELNLPKDQYADEAIEYYSNFKRLSENVKYTKWKSLKRKPLVKVYGVVFNIYLSNGFNTDFLKRLPFFKISPRQLAKIFIKLKQIV